MQVDIYSHPFLWQPDHSLRMGEAGTEAQHAEMLPTSRDWSALPLDVLLMVFTKLRAIDVLMGLGIVCCSWLEAAKVPCVWRSLDMANHRALGKMDDHVQCAMAKVAVDRSKGQLEVFLGKLFVNDEILKYIGDRYALVPVLHLIYVQFRFMFCFLFLYI